MRSILPYLIVGIATGSIYGIAGMGLVLTYTTSSIFNFGHGAIAAASAYLFYDMHVTNDVPWPIAAVICVLVIGPLFGLLLERMGTALASAATSTKVVATVGLLVALQGLIVVRYGPTTLSFPAFLPTRTVRIADVNIGVDQMITVVIGIVFAAGLYVFFRRTRLGLSMRGVVDNGELVSLTGTSPTAVRRWAWMIGSAFASVSGILIAPTLGLDPVLLTLLVVQAFGAAAIGLFSSLPLTFAGGLVIGVTASLATKYAATYDWLQAIPPSVPFLVLFGVLFFLPKGRLVEVGAFVQRRRAPDASPRSQRQSRIVGGVLAVLLLLVPQLVDTRLGVYTSALIYLILFLSLGLLVRTSGQISLCHVGFAAVGASTFSHLSQGLGLPWALALLGAALVTVPVGALLAIPAIRLSSLYLALATLGFGLLLERWGYTSGIMFGKLSTRVAERPRISALTLDTDVGYYYVVLAVAALACVIVVAVERSRFGRLLHAMADSPLALATGGTSVSQTRVLVFCISAFMAGLAGALIGPLYGSVGGRFGATFSPLQSLVLLAVLTINGNRPIAAPLMAAAAFVVIPSYITSSNAVEWLQVVFGAGAIAVALATSATGQSKVMRRLADRAAGRGRGPITARRAALTGAPSSLEAAI